MKWLSRVALMAYPRDFRERFGAEWSRTLEDMRVHQGLGSARLSWRVFTDTLGTAPRMRWENLMGTARTILTFVALLIAAAALVVGSPAIAVLLVAILAVLALQARSHDQPIRAEITQWSRRWYVWLGGAAAMFLVGFGALLTEQDGGLSTPAWAIWMLSWLAGVFLGLVALGLAATHFVRQHRL